jgi:hypothetical protein
MALGLLVGRRFSSPRLRSPAAWLAAGAGLLLAWLALRLAGGYGNFHRFEEGEPWYWFFIMTKGPPSLVYMLFNLGLMALGLAGLLALADRVGRPPLRWLVELGQAPLFVYVIHFGLYEVLGRTLAPCLSAVGLRSLAGFGVFWLVGLAPIVPLAVIYRRLKKAHPESVLQYL